MAPSLPKIVSYVPIPTPAAIFIGHQPSAASAMFAEVGAGYETIPKKDAAICNHVSRPTGCVPIRSFSSLTFPAHQAATITGCGYPFPHPQIYIANCFGQAAFISIHFLAHDSALNVYMDLNN